MRHFYLLDSNALSALVNGHEAVNRRAERARRRGDRIGTCEPVVAEIFGGLELSSTRDKNIPRMERGIELIKCWPFDRDAAREYGRIVADQRRRGRPIQVIDMMLAAVALSLGRCTVVTTDSDLSAVRGLDVENWMLPPEAE